MSDCPSCKKPVAREAATFPFCSSRCKLLDLGNWLSGKYVVNSPLSPDERIDVEHESSRKGDPS